MKTSPLSLVCLFAWLTAVLLPVCAWAQGTVQTAVPFSGCDGVVGGGVFCDMSAASSKYVCEVSDGSLLVFSKSGQLIQTKSFSSFMGSAGNDVWINPILEFDQASKRWVICGGVNPADFAVSCSDDPTGPWTASTFPFPGSFDGGRFGYNASAYFIWFPSNSGPYNTVVLDKASVLSNAGPSAWVWHYTNSPGHPTKMEDDANAYGNGSGDPMWFYDAPSGHLYTMTNYLSSAANGTAVSPTVVTTSVTGGTMAASKYGVVRNGNMAGVTDYSTPIYWSLTNLASATVTQSGNIAPPEGLNNTLWSYCCLSANGDIGICFDAETANSTYPTLPQVRMFITGRAVSDPANTMRPCVEVARGVMYNVRGPDYCTVTDDPADGTFWGCNTTAVGGGSFSGNVNFTMSGTLATVLAPVMGLGALSSDGTNVNLQWTAVPGATGYQVMRTSDQITYTVVATLSGAATSYTDQPGSPVTGYYYDVLAFNNVTSSAAPAPVHAMQAPAAPNYDTLSVPTGLTVALSGTGSGVQLSWNDVTGENGFGIERAGNGTTWTRIATTGHGVLQYTDANPAGSNLYYYRVEALDASGGQSAPSAVVTITNRPSAPTDLRVADPGYGSGTWANQVSLNWMGSSTQFNVPSATSFTIYRSTDGVNFSVIGTSFENYDGYVDNTVTAGVTYWYEVVANGVVGNSVPSNIVTATPLIAAPVQLAITQGTNQESLQWLAEPGAVSYQVLRSTDGINYSTIATTTSPAFTDTTGVANQLYYYEVVAIGSGSGNVSAPTSAFCGITPPAPSPWASNDIGLSQNEGCAGYNSNTGVFTIAGIGSDIWGTSDQFHYVSQPFAGNGFIIARVASQTNTDPWAKAGVMIRNSTAAKDQFAMMAVTPGEGVDFQYRTSSGAGAADSGNTNGPAAPYWVKIGCSGTTYTGYYSSNGTTWTQAGSVAMTMGSSSLVGLAVCSHNSGQVNVSTFDNVSMFLVPNQSMTVNAGTPASLNLLSGVTLPSGGTASVTAVTQGARGTVINNNDGTITYTPTGFGNDSFTYTISDGLGDTATATVSVTINGLRAYYKMDEGTGTTTADATGDGYTATLTGTTWGTGVEGTGGLSFAGNSGSYGSIPPLNWNTNTMTITAWIKSNATQNGGAEIVFSRASSNVCGLGFNGGGNILGYHWNNGGYNWSSGLAAPNGTWTFVALVISPTNATIYMQPLGGSMSSATNNVANAAGAIDGVTLLGGDTWPINQFFNGSMDEVRIYNTSLSAAQIAAIASVTPTVATAASATPSPVTGTTSALSVLGASNIYNESSLTYTWTATSVPNGAPTPTYSANGTNAAKNTTVTFGKAGAYTFQVTIADPGAGSVTSSVNVMVNTKAFVFWQAQTFGSNAGNAAIAGPTANPSGDGVVNLLKYAFNVNPLAPSTGELPAVSISGGNLVLKYLKNDAATDLTYTVQQSTDLSTWGTANATMTILSDSNGTSTIQASVPINGAWKLMLRLSVTQQ